MEIKKELEKIKEIEMPKEMQQRILGNCDRKMEEKNMSKNTTKSSFKKIVTVAASLVLALSVTGVTALAAAGKLEGFFKDITRWDGAVIGTSYEQATDEVEIDITPKEDGLTVEVKFMEPQKAPYSSFELLGIEKFEVRDKAGNLILEEATSELSEITAGRTSIHLPLNEILSGEYKLIITELVGSSKADQPLIMSGTWESQFIK